MKYRDPQTGEFKDITVKASDTLPIGTIVDYDGDNIPNNWELVDNSGTYKKIKKIQTSVGVLGKILNSDNDSQTDTYSCSYINSNKANILSAINKLTATELYNNNSGELGAVTLSDNYANYKYLEIYCGVEPEKINCIKMLTNIAGCILFCINITTNDIGVYINTITLSNNTISRGIGVIRWFGGDKSTTNQVKIFKVIGYK